MSNRTAITLIIVAIILLIAAAVISTYLVMDARQREAVAQAKSDAKDQVIALKQQEIDAFDASIAKRDQEFTAWQQQHNAEVAKIDTASKAVAELNKRGIKVETVPAPTPDAPSAVKYQLPDASAIPLYQSLAKCDEGDQKLSKCMNDLADTKGKFTSSQESLKEAQEKAKVWEQAAKGGSKMQRLWFALRVGGCAAAGAAPGLVSNRKDAAAIGAAVMSSSCAIVLRK